MLQSLSLLARELLTSYSFVLLALLHFLWQASLVALTVSIALRIGGSTLLRTASRRYNLLLASFALLIVLPLVTAGVHRLADQQSLERLSYSSVGQVSEQELPLLADDWETTLEASDDQPVEIVAEFVEDQPSSSVAPATDAAFSSEIALFFASQAGRSAVLLSIGLVALAWLAVVVARSARLLASHLQVQQLRRGSRPAPREVSELSLSLAHELGLRSSPEARVADQLEEAVAVGLLQPVVILPTSWAKTLEPSMLRAVLAHELAHLRRADLWVMHAQRAVETILFFHPAVWWFSRELSRERELCCDAEAIQITGERLAYAQTLQRVAAMKMADVRPALAAGIRGEKNMNLLSRVKHVLGLSTNASAPLSSWSVVSLAAPAVVAMVAAGFSPSLATVLADDEERTVEVREDAPRREPEREVDRKEEPRREEPRKEEPRREEPRKEEPRREEPRKEEPRREEPRREEPRREDRDPNREGRGDVERREVEGRENPEMRELLMLVRKLNAEVNSLRAEVNELKARGRMQGDRDVVRPREGDRPREVARPDQPRPDQPRPDQPRREPDRPRPGADRPREEPRREEPRKEEPRREADKPVERLETK